MIDVPAWLMLISSLPGANPTARMRMWRALKANGAGALRDGVYLLPHSDTARVVFEEQAESVNDAGGTARILAFDSRDRDQQTELEASFDRSADYAALFEKLCTFKSGLAAVEEVDARRQLSSLRREIAALTVIDYFPGAARAQVEQTLEDVETIVNRHFSPDEPQAVPGDITLLDRADFQGRTWATRRRLWIDRVASAWLILRFIDPDAKYVWLERPGDCPASAVGFDFNGAEFSHVAGRVTFEVLIASFGLDGDEGLARLSALVHYLDVGGVAVPEAAGFATIMAGARAEARDDEALLNAMSTVLDSLYAGYGNAARAETLDSADRRTE